MNDLATDQSDKKMLERRHPATSLNGSLSQLYRNWTWQKSILVFLVDVEKKSHLAGGVLLLWGHTSSLTPTVLALTAVREYAFKIL